MAFTNSSNLYDPYLSALWSLSKLLNLNGFFQLSQRVYSLKWLTPPLSWWPFTSRSQSYRYLQWFARIRRSNTKQWFFLISRWKIQHQWFNRVIFWWKCDRIGKRRARKDYRANIGVNYLEKRGREWRRQVENGVL